MDLKNSHSFTFYFNPKIDYRFLDESKVKRVALVGTMNNWQKSVDYLIKDPIDGAFRLTLNLKEGYYLYKFLINDEQWCEDYNSDFSLRQDDGFFKGDKGEFNSGLIIPVKEKNINIPSWAKGAIWYQIFPERFRKSGVSKISAQKLGLKKEISSWSTTSWSKAWYQKDDWNLGSFYSGIYNRRYGGNLQGIIDKLDYLKDLGVTALYLNPVFMAASDHKYDGSSFHHIDETFGPDPAGDLELIKNANETDDPCTWVWTSADLKFLELVSLIHKKGMRVIIDGVFNHSGRGFFAFLDLLKNKAESNYKDWYHIHFFDKEIEDGFLYKGWFGHSSLPEFKKIGDNFHPKYKEYLFNITKRWMCPNHQEFKDGVDGWRLDVAFCIPHGFWREWRGLVKRLNKESFLTAESMEITPEFLKGDEFDSLMNYPFAYTLVEFFCDKKNKILPSEFDKRLKVIRESYHKDLAFSMQNLISSHDTMRLRSFILNPDLSYRDYQNYHKYSKLEKNKTLNISRGGNEEIQIHKMIAFFMMTYIGAPMIYYGDEVGMPGLNDPDSRRPMLWNDIKMEDDKTHPFVSNYTQCEKNVPDFELFDFYKKLIHLRKSSKALMYGESETVLVDDERMIFGFVRRYKEEEIYIFLNNSNRPHVFDFSDERVELKAKSGSIYQKEK